MTVTVVTRASQSSPLTYDQMDGNFTNLANGVNSTPSLAALAESNGASLIGTSNGATGSATVNQLTKNNQKISVLDFYANGTSGALVDPTGVVDSTAGIQAALNASLNVDFGGFSNRFKISSVLTLRSGHHLYLNGATITQTTNLTSIFNCTSKSNIIIDGGNFIGVGTDFNNQPSSQANGVFGWYCSNIRISNCTFTSFSCGSVNFAYSTDIWVESNTIVGPGSPILTPLTSGACYGVLIDAGSSRVNVIKNHISATAQGIATGDGCSQLNIADNVIFNITAQHGIYAGSGQVDISIVNNTVSNIPLIGMKVQNYDTPALNAKNILIANNNIDTCGGNGISCYSTSIPATYTMSNVNITGNVVSNISQDGISIGASNYAVVSSNTIVNCTRQAIGFNQCTETIIEDNLIYNCGATAIIETGLSSGIDISGNRITNPAYSQIASNNYGLLIQFGTKINIKNNVITDANSNMQYGIFISGGTQTTMSLIGNIVTGANSVGARFINPVQNLLDFDGNCLNGTSGSTLYLSTTNQQGTTGRMFLGTAIPTTGTWLTGDQINNVNPTLGTASGWVCVSGGSPGTWYGTGIVGPSTSTGTGSAVLSNAPTLTGNMSIATLTSSSDIGVNGISVGRGASALVSNTAFGNAALASITTGTDNTGVGYNALKLNTSGVNNTGIGYGALFNNSNGNNNTANGTDALFSNTTGTGNTAIGQYAGYTTTPANANVSGSNNTWLGTNTGPNTTTQLSNTIAIGSGAQCSASNQTVIGVPATTNSIIYGAQAKTAPDDMSIAIPTIASATSIGPTTPIIFVSGTTAISTITAPAYNIRSAQVTIIPTGAFTTLTSGNIALASTAVVNKALIMTYDATTAKWYPSY